MPMILFLLLLCPFVIIPLVMLIISMLRGSLDDPETLTTDLGVIGGIYDYEAPIAQNDFSLFHDIGAMRGAGANTSMARWFGSPMHTMLSPKSSWMKSSARQWVFVMPHIKPSGKVLELGCGRGFHSLNLAGSFPEADFLGVDSVSVFVEEAMQEAAVYKNVRFQVHNILSDSLEGKFSVIFSVESLCYMDTTKKRIRFMQKITGALEKWGCLVIVDGFRSASFDTKSVELQVVTCLAERGLGIKRAPSKDDWIEAARGVGFRLVRNVDLTEEAIPFWNQGWRVARSVFRAFPYFARWLVSATPQTAANLLVGATAAFTLRGGAVEYGVLVFRR